MSSLTGDYCNTHCLDLELMSLLMSTDHLRPCGLMDKAPDFGSGDCRFESCHGRYFLSFESFQSTSAMTRTRYQTQSAYIGSLVTILVLCGIAFELGPSEMGATIIAVITA